MHEWREGNRDSLEGLLPLVYKELRGLAHAHLRNERPDHTRQSAALVNEAYFRLVGLDLPLWESRSHFFAIAARLMRQGFVHYGRRHRAAKRGGGAQNISLEALHDAPRREHVDVVVLDHALEALPEIDPRQCRVVALRFFGGLSLQEISVGLDIAPAAVQRDWTTARAGRYREMSKNSRT